MVLAGGADAGIINIAQFGDLVETPKASDAEDTVALLLGGGIDGAGDNDAGSINIVEDTAAL